MIDINELRRLAQEATPGPWQFWHGWVAANIDNDGGVVVAERPTPSGGKYQAKVDANFKFIAAANPAAIAELLDRLEAAESDGLEQARLNGMGGEREAALLSKLEAAENERDVLRADKATLQQMTYSLKDCLEVAEKDRDDAMQQLVRSEVDKQNISEAHKSVTSRLSSLADENVALRAKIEAMEKQEPVVEVQWAAGIPNSFLDFISTDGYLPKLGDKLYALPGAKGEEK